jgi:YidC/Oxa1 family membrane protein insertase
MQPLSAIINFIYSIIQNYGVAIIIFTVLIKAVLFPFNLKGMRASMNMQRLQPKLKAIQEKYKEDKQKQMQEQQNLYKREKINPMAGCLPQVIPIIILFAIYYIVCQPLTHIMHLSNEQIQEQYYQPLVDMQVIPGDKDYAHSTYKNRQVDLMNLALDNGVIPEQPINFNFLGLDISKSPSQALAKGWLNWYWIFPFLTLITAWGSQKIMMDGIKRMNADKDPKKKKTEVEQKTEDMQNQMNSMMKFMPIFTAWITFQFSAALGLYWVISNITQILQQWYINETVRNPRKENN